MRSLAPFVQVLAAVCALVLAAALFQGPLLGRMPPGVADAASKLPGFGASQGFVAQILSEPSGAEVRIDGVLRGTTPFFGNARCRADEEIVIEVVADGYKTWQRRLPCRVGDTLTATARLEKAGR